MSKIDSILVDLDAEIENANKVKECVLKKLVRDGVITEEQYDKYAHDYQMIIVKKSWFKTWLEKVSSGDENGYIYKYVNFNE